MTDIILELVGAVVGPLIKWWLIAVIESSKFLYACYWWFIGD